MTDRLLFIDADMMYRTVMHGEVPAEDGGDWTSIWVHDSEGTTYGRVGEGAEAARRILPCDQKPQFQLQEVRIDDLAEDDKDCAICFQPYSKESTPIRMPCGHVYGSDCILSWAQSQGTSLSCPMCRDNPLADIWTIHNALAEVGILAYPDGEDLVNFDNIRDALFWWPSPLQAFRLNAIFAYLRHEATVVPEKRFYDLTSWQIMVLFRIMHERKASDCIVTCELRALTKQMGRLARKCKAAADGSAIGKVSWTEEGPSLEIVEKREKDNDILHELLYLLREEGAQHPQRREIVVRGMQTWNIVSSDR